MNKTGLAALAALLGAGLITTKTFKSSYASETFMAKGKRAVALRAGKINSTDLKDVYYDQWSSKYADVLFKNTNTTLTNDQLQRMSYQSPVLEMIQHRPTYYFSLCHSINDIYKQAFLKNNQTKLRQITGILTQAFSKLNDAMVLGMEAGQDKQTFLDSKEGKKALEDFKDEVLKTKTIIPKYQLQGYRLDRLPYIENDTTLETILNMVNGNSYGGLNNRIIKDFIERLEWDAKSPDFNAIMGQDIYAQDRYYGGGVRIYSLYADETQIKEIKEYIVENFTISLYAKILGYNQFFKANPQIKSVADIKYDDKYYPVVFGYGPDKTAPPKASEYPALVWDTDLFSQFTQAEFEDLFEDCVDLLENEIKKTEREINRMEKKKGRLANRIESEQNEILKRELEAVFSPYDSLDATEKSGMVKAYLSDILNLPYKGGGQDRLIIWFEDFPMVERVNPYYVAQEPRIVRETIEWSQLNPMIKERGIEISVPASLKEDAKKSFEAAMNDMIEAKEEQIATAQTQIESYQNNLKEGLKRF